MSRPPDPDSTPFPRALAILPAALVAVTLILPPETRGESQAGAAALVALLGLLTARRTTALSGLAVLGLALVAVLPITRAAEAPGAVPEVLAVLALGVAAGTFATALPRRAGGDRALVTTLAVVGAVVAAWGVLQSLHSLGELARGIESGLPVADEAEVLVRARTGRAFAGFPTPAALGGCLALALPVTVAAALERRGRMRVAWLALAALQGAGLVAARSATAAGALVVALGLFAVLSRPARRLAAVALVVAAAALGAIAVLRGPELLDATGPESAWRLRAGNARIAIEIIADHPWIGVGPGGYGEAFPRYRRPGDNESQHVHVVPLELCAEWGLPLGLAGTAAFLWVFLAPLVRRRAPVEAPWKSGAAIGLAALALQNLADFTLLLPSLLWSAALVRGWLEADPASRSDGLPGPLPILRPMALVATIAAATVAGLGGLAWNERFIARQALVDGDREVAVESARRASRLAPWSPEGWLLVGGIALDGAPPDEPLAAHAAERAIALAPTRPAARLLRSRIRVLDRDLPGAYADAVEAARLYPSSPVYARRLADLAARFRSADEAPR